MCLSFGRPIMPLFILDFKYLSRYLYYLHEFCFERLVLVNIWIFLCIQNSTSVNIQVYQFIASKCSCVQSNCFSDYVLFQNFQNPYQFLLQLGNFSLWEKQWFYRPKTRFENKDRQRINNRIFDKLPKKG